MKKIISLILTVTTLMTLLVVFSACSGGLVSTITASDAKAQTIVIAAIKDEATTDEAILRVQDALNEITETKFNTHVILRFFTADEYVSKILSLTQKMEAKQLEYEANGDTRLNGSTVEDTRYDLLDNKSDYTVEENGDLTYKDEFGRTVTVYPPVSDDQIDILFVDSLATYYELIDKKYIISLGSDFVAHPELKKYINNSFFDQLMTIGDLHEEGGVDKGVLYAIPNNYIARDYDYILVNKKLYDYYQYDIKCDLTVTDKNNNAGCDDLADFLYFMNDVLANNDTVPDDLKVDRVLYNYTGLQFESFYGCGDGTDTCVNLPSSAVSFSNGGLRYMTSTLFSRSLFKKVESFLYDLRTKTGKAPYEGECFYRSTTDETGYAVPAVNMEDNAETFALAMVSGDANVSDYYNKDDYYVVKTAAPVLDNKMFESMFAVSTFSSTAVDDSGISITMKVRDYDMQTNPRCMELIALLETNAEVVDLLTYGVQNINYDVYDNDPVLHNTGKGGYIPVIGKVGNTFLCSANDKMNVKEAYYAADGWNAAKMQNRYMLVSPFCGMYLHDIDKEGVDMKASQINAFFSEYYREAMEKIKAFDGHDDSGKEVTIEKYISSIDSELKKTDEFRMSSLEYKVITDEYPGPTYESLPLAQYTWFFTLTTTGSGDYGG